MVNKSKLNLTMSLVEFDHGYWYAEELKAFAKKLGVPKANALRKDELERLVRHYLVAGDLPLTPETPRAPKAPRDSDGGLSLDQFVIEYTNNAATKDFILLQAQKIDPKFKIKSGTRYLLNRWREEQLRAGVRITYRDLVFKIMSLAEEHSGPLRTKHGRYNNFLSDFMRAEAGSHQEAVKAWNEIKRLDTPKTYAHWVKAKNGS